MKPNKLSHFGNCPPKIKAKYLSPKKKTASTPRYGLTSKIRFKIPTK